MTVVRYKNRLNADGAFNNLLSDLFPQTPSIYRSESTQVAPMNIRETEKEYILDLVAPGLNKEDFTINLDNNLLTVAVEKKEETAKENEKVIRREFRQTAFKRS